MEAICIVCKKPFLKKGNKQKLCGEECRKSHIQKVKKDYRLKYKEKIKLYGKKWREENKKRISELNKQYLERKLQLKRTSKYKDKANKRKKERRQTDLNYKLIENLRIDLIRRLRKRTIKKKSKTLELLGIEIKYFKKYLEHRFKTGMTWENQGKVWHIDHIIPLACLDLTREDVLKFAFNYRNMQPMFADENTKKGADIFIPVEKGMKLRDVDYLVKNVLEKCRPDYEFDFQIKKDGVLLKYIKD